MDHRQCGAVLRRLGEHRQRCRKRHRAGGVALRRHSSRCQSPLRSRQGGVLRGRDRGRADRRRSALDLRPCLGYLAGSARDCRPQPGDRTERSCHGAERSMVCGIAPRRDGACGPPRWSPMASISLPMSSPPSASPRCRPRSVNGISGAGSYPCRGDGGLRALVRDDDDLQFGGRPDGCSTAARRGAPHPRAGGGERRRRDRGSRPPHALCRQAHLPGISPGGPGNHDGGSSRMRFATTSRTRCARKCSNLVITIHVEPEEKAKQHGVPVL